MANDFPSYTVEIAFNSNQPAGYWQLGVSQLDVSAALGGTWGSATYQTMSGVLAVSIRRGRQDETNAIQAGTCDILLDNGDGRFSPENAASPYYPNILPMRPVRVSAVWQGQTYRLFTGFVESFTPQDNGPLDSNVALSCVDWQKWSNLAQLNTSLAAADEATRLQTVLTAVGYGQAAVALDAGIEPLLAANLTDTSTTAQAHIDDIVAAGQGLFFVARDGTLTFHNRYHRWQATRSTTIQATYGQVNPSTGKYDPGVLPYTDLLYTLHDRYIVNDARVRATGTAEATQVSGDTTSQSLYGTRTLEIASPVLTTGRATYVAQYLTALRKDPHPRVQHVVLDGDASHALWPVLLATEIGDLVQVVKWGPGALSLNKRCWVEQVQHDVKDNLGGHTVTLQLSDASQGKPPWQLGVSQLDTSAGLAL